MRSSTVATLPALAVALLLPALGACGEPEPAREPEPERQPQEAPEDGRIAIPVPTAARAAVRTEMRQMLTALNEVLRAVPQGDPGATAAAARRGGMAIAVDTDPALEARFPPEFLRLGVSTHEQFDAIAAAAEGGAPRDTIVARLGRLTGSCVACHEAYRLEPEPTDGP